MPAKKRASRRSTSVRAGNFSDISGSVNVRNITTHYTVRGLSAAEIKQLFDGLCNTIEARTNTPLADKEDLKADVKEIQSTVTEP